MSRSSAIREHSASSSGWRTVLLLGCGYLAMTLLVAILPSRSTALGPASPAVAAGADVWRAANCIGCHAIYGLGGHIGPDLTNAISRLGAEGVTGALDAGGTRMPRFAFSPKAAANLVAWLSYIDQTGVYPLPQHFAPGYGDIR
jgi:nitric oxide reductase subunit C